MVLARFLECWPAGATVNGAEASAYLGGIEDEREQRGAAFGVLQGMLVNGVDEAMGFCS